MNQHNIYPVAGAFGGVAMAVPAMRAVREVLGKRAAATAVGNGVNECNAGGLPMVWKPARVPYLRAFPPVPYTSRFLTSSAFSSMNLRRGST